MFANRGRLPRDVIDRALTVACNWLGNSAPIAAKQYLQVADDYLGRAAAPMPGARCALHNPMQPVEERAGSTLPDSETGDFGSDEE